MGRSSSNGHELDNIMVGDKEEKSPHERFYNQTTKYETHLKVFGEVGIVTKSNTSKTKAKLDNRGIPCIFVGYPKNHTGETYRMFNPITNKTIITRDIIWTNKMYHEYTKTKRGPIIEVDEFETSKEMDNEQEKGNHESNNEDLEQKEGETQDPKEVTDDHELTINT